MRKLAAVFAAAAAVLACLPLTVVGIAVLAARRSSAAPCVSTPILVASRVTAGLTAQQSANAQIIIQTGQTMGVGPAGEVIAVAAALTESRMINVPFGDRDSLGLFQQRPSQGWGTPAQIMNPVYSSTRFYRALLVVSGWQQMNPGAAAQAVERSAFPGRYSANVPLAAQTVAAFAPGAPPALQLAGNCPPATPGQPATGAVGPGYINPFTAGLWTAGRIDQGVDFCPRAPAPVLAIADGTVTYSNPTGWGQYGTFMVLHVNSGSHANLDLFVAEHLASLTPAGTAVRAGTQIATALPGSPCTEWGFAACPTCAYPAVRYGGNPDGQPMSGGVAFARFLIELGAPHPYDWRQPDGSYKVADPPPGPDRP